MCHYAVVRAAGKNDLQIQVHKLNKTDKNVQKVRREVAKANKLAVLLL